MGRSGHSQRASGSLAAFEPVVRAHYDQVRRLCALLVDSPSADDLAQETFLRAYQSFASYRGASSVRTWIFAVARHTCLDELRARDRGRRTSERHRPVGASAPDPAGDIVVADLLGALDENRRSAFVLTQIFGLSYAEAARVCRCPVGTIRSRLARARRDLIDAIEAGEPRWVVDQSRRESGSQ